MIRIGNVFFHYRNALFPVAYLLLFIPSAPLLRGYGIAAVLGLTIASAGQGIRAVTIGLAYIIRGGRNRQVYASDLVQGGIFAHCRNPLYLGNYLIVLGVGLASNSVLFACAGIPFFTLAYWAIIAAEEDYLRKKFGQEFDNYCKRVNRVIPNLTGITRTIASMAFNWRRLVTAEYGSAFIWMAGIIAVILEHLWLRGEYRSSGTLVAVLWALLILVTVAFGIARFLKKTRLLKTDREASYKCPPESARV